jgi:hypothetical protein
MSRLTELAAGPLAEGDQPGPEGVAARGQLPGVAEGHTGAQQPVDGGHRQIRDGRQIAEGHLAAGVEDGLEQLEDALDGLDGS